MIIVGSLAASIIRPDRSVKGLSCKKTIGSDTVLYAACLISLELGFETNESFARHPFSRFLTVKKETLCRIYKFDDGFRLCSVVSRFVPTLTLCKFNIKVTSKTIMSQHVLLEIQELKTIFSIYVSLSELPRTNYNVL